MEDLQSQIDARQWKKTNYIQPHEYVVKFWDVAFYETMRKLIEEKGYNEMFLTKEWRYYNIGGYKYWIDEPVLNRAKLLTTESKIANNDLIK